MRLLWQAPERTVAWWWALLVLAGCTNIVLWCLLYRMLEEGAARVDGGISMLMLSGAYVFGCAFRSFLPRADVQRFCLFDTWLSSIVIGRSVATIAEVSFAAQWALILKLLGEVSGVSGATLLAPCVVPLIIVAQICSWYGVLTTNSLINAVENSIWAITFALIGCVLLQVAPVFEGVVHVAIILTLVGIGAYLAFLLFVDVPMYVSRGRGRPRDILSLREGLRDAARRRVVTHQIMHWRDEMPWMSLYFTAAVWMSLLLGLGYAMSGQLPQYRVDVAADHTTSRGKGDVEPASVGQWTRGLWQ